MYALTFVRDIHERILICLQDLTRKINFISPIQIFFTKKLYPNQIFFKFVKKNVLHCHIWSTSYLPQKVKAEVLANK